MRAVTGAQMRRLDQYAIRHTGTSGLQLMQRAGCGLARVLMDELESMGGRAMRVLLLAGCGNNGGDAFAAACSLHAWGWSAVEIWLAAERTAVKGDAGTCLHNVLQAGLPLRELPQARDWICLQDLPPGRIVLVDGLLGTGSRGEPRGVIAEAVRFARRQVEHVLSIIAIDIPSGLDGDSGLPCNLVVPADRTVTMGYPKIGLLQPAARAVAGAVDVVDIGIPPAALPPAERAGGCELIVAAEVAASLVRRRTEDHKGSYGRTVLVGGAAGFSGAMVLAARAALRSGVGSVTAVVPRGIAPIVAASVPEAMVHAAPETGCGALAASGWPSWCGHTEQAQSLLLGPGLTRGPEQRALILKALRMSPIPMVFDADALSALAGELAQFKQAAAPVVLTPHPGELARLLGCATGDIAADRAAAALAAAERSGAVVVLKGSGTLVAGPEGSLAVNTTGNPGLATGGSGDVLAGLLAGLLAQGMAAPAAARAAVWLHGTAADHAVRGGHHCQAGLTAGDVAAALPAALRRCMPR